MITKATKEGIKKAPENAGVYFFCDKKGNILYIGKAKNLKSRLSSYFNNDLIYKTKKMVAGADCIKTINVNSEIEALLLEAKLVRKYMPKYNSQLKDDKTPVYIGITDEEFERVLTLRRTNLDQYKLKKVWGPFINGVSTKFILRSLRKIIPYSKHKPGKRACVEHQIGLCNPCPSEIVNNNDIKKKKKFKKNIRQLRSILNGNIKSVRKSLEKEMREYSKKDKFEEANEILKKIDALDYVTTPQMSVSQYLKNPNLIEDIRFQELKELINILKNNGLIVDSLERIECYDVAHTAGVYPTASLVSFLNGEADKTYYRHFKVDPKIKNNDYESMKSVLGRRIKHLKTWGKPDLIIVDGGKPQVSAAVQILKSEIPVIGIAKRLETIVFPVEDGFKEYTMEPGPAKNLIQRIRNESHRFARRYHHKLISKALRQ